MGLHLENKVARQVATVKTLTIISNNPVHISSWRYH